MEPATEQRIASVPSLDDIARDPGCAGGLPPRTLAALQSRAAVVQAALAAEALAATETVQGRSHGNQPVPAMGLLTAKQMAEYLKVPESWVRSEARADRIPKRMIGRYVRFDASEVERALSQRRVACR
jgi:excisionase family DNA binding protein